MSSEKWNLSQSYYNCDGNNLKESKFSNILYLNPILSKTSIFSIQQSDYFLFPWASTMKGVFGYQIHCQEILRIAIAIDLWRD